MAAFDLETTGPDPEDARIVTAHLDGMDLLVNPGIPIPAEATAIHGITTEEAVEVGIEEDVAVRTLVARLVTLADQGTPVVAFNASYDFTVLDRAIRRAPAGSWRLPFGLLVLDPYVLDKEVDTYRKGSRKLVDVARHYGVALDGAHEAKADAETAVGIVRKIAEQYPMVGGRPVFVVHNEQIRWAWRQRVALEQHFQKTDPDARVSPYWPVQPWHLAERDR